MGPKQRVSLSLSRTWNIDGSFYWAHLSRFHHKTEIRIALYLSSSSQLVEQYRTILLWGIWKISKIVLEVEVNLRLTVSRPVCLCVRRPCRTRDQFSFLLEISFRHLRVSYFIAPSLTRGRVCNLLVQLLLGLARAVTHESKSHRTHDHILLSH
jgi:hypothetical protein